MASTVAHSDIVTSSLAGPGTATTAARSDVLPVGVPLPWLTGTPPSGFILMDGSNVSRTTYAPLFALWGTTYGVGDGTTTFGLPDWRGRSLIGAGLGVYSGATTHALGQTIGEETHTLTVAETPSHAHSYPNTAGTGGGANIAEGAPNAGTGTNMNTTGGGGAHNTYHPVFATNWIVRAL